MWRSYECKRKSRDIGQADNILLKGEVRQGPAKQSVIGTCHKLRGGGGGLQHRRGVHVKFYLYEKGGGARGGGGRKSSSHAEGEAQQVLG